MRVASEQINVDEAIRRVEAYARRFPRTLEIFDGIGRVELADSDPDRVTLADIGRLVVIDAQLRADDVPVLLGVDAGAQLAAVPFDAKLEDADYGGILWVAASDLLDRFTGLEGVDRSKRSKLLHVKRPGMFFISDNRTGSAYQVVADAFAKDRDDASLGYWEAAQADIVQPAFVELMGRLDDWSVDSDSGTLRLGHLSRVRVLDIVCWSPAA
ncbi:MAG: hypothetical protein JWR27_1477 [Aeromicrobium sp.]|jgi:hypothetical protein|nr:hypothetical protein [Aeromicrobium sp.]